MKLEVGYHGKMQTQEIWVYDIKATLGKAPIFYSMILEIPVNDQNPQGEENIHAACNRFIEKFQAILEIAGAGTVNLQMSAENVKVQVHNILCQNVEGILQPDQPKWLITPREI